jgi:HlyD family secretion protein
MSSKLTIIVVFLSVLFFGCRSNSMKYDATGTFEADEVIVSAEVGGRILSFPIAEGQQIAKDTLVARIDVKQLSLQEEQVRASRKALNEKQAELQPQVQLLEKQSQVQKAQLESLQRERNRFERLVKADAATKKQLDDIDSQIDVLKKQMDVTRQQILVQTSTVNTQNRSVMSEALPLEKREEVLRDQVNRGNIINPLAGTVLMKYAEEGEMAMPGKALYKIADLKHMTLRAYATGDQLPGIQLRQPVKVYIDGPNGVDKEYNGVVTWISDKAEFTPKTIQTKEERANLVYAVKITVPNDGAIKLGMYGEVKFK